MARRLKRIARQMDPAAEGRDKHFMTLDSWNQDGNYQARHDEFGPEMEQEAPPTLNGKPL
ncbi:hypothetical protein [Gorillibacterium sp. sgz5001074]|uniref:hypothetical protein n=1 Tax=Gorillibacterium sp. sgz5001074 TaxID=3446695 RepID=UPI003F67251C